MLIAFADAKGSANVSAKGLANIDINMYQPIHLYLG